MRLTLVATVHLMLAASTLIYYTADAWHLPLRLLDRQLTADGQESKRGSYRRPTEMFSLEESGGYPHSAQVLGEKRVRQIMPIAVDEVSNDHLSRSRNLYLFRWG